AEPVAPLRKVGDHLRGDLQVACLRSQVEEANGLFQLITKRAPRSELGGEIRKLLQSALGAIRVVPEGGVGALLFELSYPALLAGLVKAEPAGPPGARAASELRRQRPAWFPQIRATEWEIVSFRCMVYWLHRLVAPLTRLAPLWFSYAIASLIGWCAFFVFPDKRANAIKNMRSVLGAEAERQSVRGLAHRAFVNYAKYLIDMMRLTGISVEDLERQVTVTGWENFLEARDEGGGLIFVGGHFGNSDFAAAILAGRGFPVNVIAEPLEPPRWDAMVQAAR